MVVMLQGIFRTCKQQMSREQKFSSLLHFYKRPTQQIKHPFPMYSSAETNIAIARKHCQIGLQSTVQGILFVGHTSYSDNQRLNSAWICYADGGVDVTLNGARRITLLSSMTKLHLSSVWHATTIRQQFSI